jgi:hypothetical protein
MGGNVVDSLPGRESRWAGTLLGPEGTAVDHVSGRGRSSVPGSGLETTSPTWSGWWCPLWSGVRWGVCELDSGCEHLVVLDCCSVVFN